MGLSAPDHHVVAGLRGESRPGVLIQEHLDRLTPQAATKIDKMMNGVHARNTWPPVYRTSHGRCFWARRQSASSLRLPEAQETTRQTMEAMEAMMSGSRGPNEIGREELATAKDPPLTKAAGHTPPALFPSAHEHDHVRGISTQTRKRPADHLAQGHLIDPRHLGTHDDGECRWRRRRPGPCWRSGNACGIEWLEARGRPHGAVMATACRTPRPPR